MKIVLTICSANYLAHARVLGDTLAVSNSDYKLVIGLMDRMPPDFPPAARPPYELFPVEDLGIPEFADMSKKYDIVELNTAVKPFYMEQLYRRSDSVQSVMYIDPDIMVLGSFAALEAKLSNHDFAVTPHSCTYDDGADNIYYEIAMLMTGVFNLGFIATKRGPEVFRFLKWWQKRLLDHCYYRPGSGVFVDQQWVTLAPLYFDGVYVERDPGYNMCYWNHFERQLSYSGKKIHVNKTHDLVFYHFSSYSPAKPEIVANRPGQRVTTFAERPDLKPLYDDYGRRLLAAGYDSIRGFKCVFGRQAVVPVKPKPTLRSNVKDSLKGTLKMIPRPIRGRLGRLARFVSDNC